MGVIPSLPHANLPAGTLNKVGDPLAKTVDPAEQNIITNSIKNSNKTDKSNFYDHRQVFVGIVLRVDNDKIVKKPDAEMPGVAGFLKRVLSPTEDTPIDPVMLKLRVFIPAIHAPKGVLTRSWPTGPNDHFTISQQYPQFVTAEKSLFKKPEVGDCVIISVQNPKSQDLYGAGNVLGYAFENNSKADILRVDVFGTSTCAEPRSEVAEKRAVEREKIASRNRARGINEETPNRPGGNRSQPQQPQQQEAEGQETQQPNNSPGETDGTPRCNKTYSLKGVMKREEFHTNLAVPTEPKNGKEVTLWAWGKKRGTAKAVKHQGRVITENLLGPWKKLQKAAKQDGVRLKLNSAYRDPVDQRRLRRKFVNPKKKKEFEENGFVIDEVTGKRYTEFDTPEMERVVNGRSVRPNTFIMNASGRALKRGDKRTQNFDRAVGRPAMGGPGHHTGLAVDVSTGLGLVKRRLSNIQKRSPQYYWLAHNAHKYGFVRNVSSERWHYHYYKRPKSKATMKISPGHWSWDDVFKKKVTWLTDKKTGEKYPLIGL